MVSDESESGWFFSLRPRSSTEMPTTCEDGLVEYRKVDLILYSAGD